MMSIKTDLKPVEEYIVCKGKRIGKITHLQVIDDTLVVTFKLNKNASKKIKKHLLECCRTELTQL